MRYKLVPATPSARYRWRAELLSDPDRAGVGDSELNAVADLVAQVAFSAPIDGDLILSQWDQWEPWGKREVVRLAAERAKYWQRACQSALDNKATGHPVHPLDQSSIKKHAGRWGATATMLLAIHQSISTPETTP